MKELKANSSKRINNERIKGKFLEENQSEALEVLMIHTNIFFSSSTSAFIEV